MNYYGPKEIRAAIEPHELISELKKQLAAPHQTSPRLVLGAEGNSIGSMLAANQNLLGGKMVCVFPNNTLQGLNPHQGIVALFSPANGRPTDLFEASAITGLRTAALSAAALQCLAPLVLDTLVIYGAGLQAYLHAIMISKVRPIKKVLLLARNKTKASALCSKIRAELKVSAMVINAAGLPRDPAIICLCTAAISPYLEEADIPSGSFVTAVGACRPGMQEIRLRTPTKMKIYVDDLSRIREEASELDGQEDLDLIGPLFSTQGPPFHTSGRTILFKSVGTGLLDIVTADLVRRKLA